MADLLMLAVVAGFFALCVGYIALCDRILGPDADALGPDALGAGALGDATAVGEHPRAVEVTA